MFFLRPTGPDDPLEPKRDRIGLVDKFKSPAEIFLNPPWRADRANS